VLQMKLKHLLCWPLRVRSQAFGTVFRNGMSLVF